MKASQFDEFFCNMLACARVVELVDTRDLKSLGLTAVPVQVRVRVPFFNIYKSMIYEKLRRQSGVDFRGDTFLGKDWESSGEQLHFRNKTMNSSRI